MEQAIAVNGFITATVIDDIYLIKERQGMQPSHHLNCPRCGQIDRVEKVSSIYQNGIATGNYAGASLGVGAVGGNLMVTRSVTNLSGTNQTQLSQMLTPPLHPNQYYRSQTGFSTSLIIFGVLLLVMLPCAVSLVSMGSQSVSMSPALIGSLVVSLGFIVAGAILNGRANAARNARVQATIPQWQRACANWDGLYYCSRDDIVFFPGSPTGHVHPSQIHTIL